MTDTTIHVSSFVKEKLDEIKGLEGHKTYDSVLRRLLWLYEDMVVRSGA